MPAFPVEVERPSSALFERGDHIYLTTPVQVFTPTEQQIEEFAFSAQVKKSAPNENIVWFKGQYVEADHPNGNGAQWRANELAIKSLTPMLMPVTVMHDPRTAVGTIADVALLTPEKDGVPRARIDTVLALWGHRFPEAVHEAEVNAQQGSLMQSMECYSPWYECSTCGQVFHKLPQGAEQAQWCDHLRASNPSAGYVDLSKAAAQSQNASRILGDVTFTGTGLIFGTRGARGAYSEAYLEEFQEELASFHQNVHTSTATSTSLRSEGMGLVQIEQSELDRLRQERDEARGEVAELKPKADKLPQVEASLERVEAEKTAAEERATTAERERDQEREVRARAELKQSRMDKLGAGFVAKLGDHTKTRLNEQAGTMSDEDWEARLAEVEELVAVKRDAGREEKGGEGEGEGGPTFSRDELAALNPGSGGSGNGTPSDVQRSAVVGSLAAAFRKK